ncbi:MAG TPA: flagellar hook-associated protein FlgK [Pseudolabrys sp.]|nr:flagellar hook-associated protein FlgK [Pseudolabrys sp.]
MSLTQALTTALSGLNAAQTSLSLVAGNVANSQTPGYVRKVAVLTQNSVGTDGTSVQVAAINRVLDQFVQAQLRTESAGAGYADVRSKLFSQLQDVYGTPNTTSTLESSFNTFTSALQALTTSPDDPTAKSAVLTAAQQFAQQLNTMSDGVQGLRQQAELALSDDVSQANNCMQQIAQLNEQLSAAGQDSSAASLADQRDAYISQLSKLMDIRVINSGNNQVTVLTSSGVELVGAKASTLSFDAQGVVTPQAQWSADPAKRTIGTVTLTSPNGAKTDLVANGALRGGEIAGYLEMRDQTLVQAQAQLDQLAGAMASALSDTTTDGTGVTSGAQAGFDVDIGALQAGNTVSITYTDTATSKQHQITLMRVDDPSALPLSNNATTNPNDTVIGLDFSGGMASVVAQINAALGGTGMTASNPAGTTLRVLDDGAANTVDVNAMSATATATSLTGSVAMPFFMDGSIPYTGAITSTGAESAGFAGRIAVNQSLLDDPSKLVAYQSSIDAADATRPNFLYDQMVNATLTYSPTAGIGTAGSPFSADAGTYLRQIISVQGAAAANASSLAQGQDVVLSSLQQRFDNGSGVNIDQEMSDLLSLQNAYAANARVMSTVRDMLTSLMQM